MDTSDSAAPESAPVPVRTFARGFALRAPQTAWLLGAGASADAHIPTAAQLIDQLLARLYSSEQGVPLDELLSDGRWRTRVRHFYDGTHGLPPLADDAFYSGIFELVYPDRDARARFVMEQFAGFEPHLGQHTLAALVASGLASVLITPNFDTLLEDAIRPMLGPNERLTVLEPEASSRASFALATAARPLLIKIHGDLGAVTVANTSTELRAHDADLRAATLSLLGKHGLIIVGYSGRDPAVMGMLREVLSHPTPFPAGLTWVRRPEDDLSDEVAELLAKARAAGVTPVHEVVTAGMTELMVEVERAVTLPEPVKAKLAKHRPPVLRAPAPAPGGPVGEYPQVRLAALPLLGLPEQARLLEGPSVPLAKLRQALREHHARAVFGQLGGRLAAFGDDARLREPLAQHDVRVTCDTVALAVTRRDEPDSAVVGMVAEALARALGRTRGVTEVLRTGQRHLLRARDDTAARTEDNAALEKLRQAAQGAVTGYLPGPAGSRLPWAEAVALGVEWHDGGGWLLFAPDVWVRPTFVDLPGDYPADKAKAEATRLGAEFVRGRVAGRYNSATGTLLGAWLRLLTGGATGDERIVHAFGLGTDRGVDATFTFGIHPLVSPRLRGNALRSTA